MKNLLLTTLLAAGLMANSLALDLRLRADDDELFVPKASIAYVLKQGGAAIVGTSMGSFKVTPIGTDKAFGVEGAQVRQSWCS